MKWVWVHILVDGLDADVVDKSETFDLAIVRTSSPLDKDIAQFSQNPAGLNDDITVAGYPLAQVLRGLNITRGSVSSSAGLRGYDTLFQMTAPVQPGNSGGPVVNQYGEIVGVVVGKLAPLENGQIPENVNFAIRGEIAKAFLALNGLDPKITASPQSLNAEGMAKLLQKISVFIECEP